MTVPLPDHMTAATLSEVRKLARDLIAMAEALWGLSQRRKDRRAARDLYGIAFKPGGMKGLLQKIVDGNVTQQDISSLEGMLLTSDDNIQKHIRRLSKYSDTFREQFGFTVSMALDGAIYGKGTIRHDIADVIDEYRSPGRNLRGMSFTEIAASAIRDIDKLNVRLSEAHDRILSCGPMAKSETSTKTGEANLKRRTKSAAVSNSPENKPEPDRRNRSPKTA